MEDAARSSATPVIELNGDEFWPLSGAPYFDVILKKIPCQANLPDGKRSQAPATLDPVLPADTSVPMVLSYGDKSWEMTYNETKHGKLVDRNSWKAFVDEKRLKVGDACVFELRQSDSTKILFQVQILRGDIPAELIEKYSKEDEK